MSASQSRGQGKRCRELGPWLSAYVDGELNGVEQIPFRCRIEEHLEYCAACVERVGQWGHDAGLLVIGQDEVPAAPWFQQRFSRRLAKLESDGLWARLRVEALFDAVRWVLWRALPVAVIFLGLGLGALLRVQIGSRSPAEAFLQGQARFESSALAANGSFVVELRLMDAIDFEEVLRPGLSPLGRRTPVVDVSLAEVGWTPGAIGGVESDGVALSGRPEKDR